jgi:hypothetical protein
VVIHPVSRRSIQTTRIETHMGMIEVWDQTDSPEANARLLAAAPDILDALKGLMSREHCECDPKPGFACKHILDAEAAIAKVEGR